MSVHDYREWFWFAGSIYAMAFIYGLHAIVRFRRYSRWGMLLLMGIGWGVQTWAMGLRGAELGGCPLGNTFELLQFVSWSAVLLYFLIGPAFRMSLLGLFSAGLGAGLGFGSLLRPAWDGPYVQRLFGGEPLLETHGSLAVFSYGVFAMLALVGLMHFLQHYGLKHRRSTGVFSLLPSIVQLEQIAKRLLAVGVGILTLSLICGAVLYFDPNHNISIFKMVATWLVWAAYTGFLLLSLRRLVAGTSFARWSVVLFLVALASLWPVDVGRRTDSSSNANPFRLEGVTR